MAPPKFVVERAALLKILLHALKYPAFAVNGILLGKVEGGAASPPSSPRAAAAGAAPLVRVLDVAPVCHTHLALPLPMELAACQAEAACAAAGGGTRIVGYYQCNEQLADGELGPVGRRIADRLATLSPPGGALLLDGGALERLLAGGGGGGAPPLALWHAPGGEGGRGWARAPAADLECAAAGVAPLLAALVAERRHWRLADFEDHLDDVAADWQNAGLLD